MLELAQSVNHIGMIMHFYQIAFTIVKPICQNWHMGMCSLTNCPRLHECTIADHVAYAQLLCHQICTLALMKVPYSL